MTNVNCVTIKKNCHTFNLQIEESKQYSNWQPETFDIRYLTLIVSIS